MSRVYDPRLLPLALAGVLSAEEAAALVDAQEAENHREYTLPAQLAHAPHTHPLHYRTNAQQTNVPPGITGAASSTGTEFVFTTMRDERSTSFGGLIPEPDDTEPMTVKLPPRRG